MAENESLDINSTYGRRWKIVVHSATSGKSHREIGCEFKKTLHAGLRRAIQQLEKYDITITDLLAARNTSQDFRQLLKKCHGHSYAKLLVDCIQAHWYDSPDQIVLNWLYLVRDKIGDQIKVAITGTEHYPSVHEVEALFESVESQIERDLENVAQKLILDPTHVPNALPERHVDRPDQTESILSMSLLQQGGQ